MRRFPIAETSNLIDDDGKITALLATILGKMGGYEVKEENRSHFAAEVAREFRPDLGLLDVEMPGKNGYEVALEFSQDSMLRKAPVLFLTALVSPKQEGVLNQVSSGVHFMAKSLDPDALLERVEAMVSSAVDHLN